MITPLQSDFKTNMVDAGADVHVLTMVDNFGSYVDAMESKCNLLAVCINVLYSLSYTYIEIDNIFRNQKNRLILQDYCKITAIQGSISTNVENFKVIIEN
jgi:hypothetical protein